MIAANCIFLSAIFLAMAMSPAAAQQSQREIVTTANSDYLGFDLRSEKNVSLDQCKSMCLSDPKCKAFTFNTRVNWCFLKSDFDEITQFQGAIAGKVVEGVNEADLGAPPKLEFVSAGILDQAHALARRAEKEQKSGATGSADEFMDSAVQSLGSNETLDAARNFASAAALEPENGARWLEIAERTNRWLEVNNNSDYRLQEVASSAAIVAYELSRTASTRAHALVVLAKALENRSQYRPALEAYKKSLELKNSEEVAAAYKELREKHGFRVTGNSVEADEAAPSICVTFSEDLVKSGVDYSSFVTLDGKSSGAIEASGQSICARGLEHGNTYRLTLRAGLPSAVGEVLDSPVVINSYIRDRDPAVRFTGEGFVLPSAARHAIPIVGINATSADLTLYRIGERALPDLLSGSQFLTQLEGYSAESIGDELGEKIWEGKIDLVRERNRDAVTAVPVEEILAKRQPGVYVLTAAVTGTEAESWEPRATQWFLISDIGLSTFDGEDGLTVVARSLDSAKVIAGAEVQLIARNNEVLASAATDADGKAQFASGLMRGVGGNAPQVVTAHLRAGEIDDFSFLDVSSAGFDLSDRGVTGRTVSGPLDLFTYTDRGIYRPGESVEAVSLVRNDSMQSAEDLPLTAIIYRPDGVEATRIVSKEAALAAHAFSYAFPEDAQRGAWRIAIHADPDDEVLGEVTVLVEDFVPDRTEFDLKTDAKAIGPGSPATIHVAGRFLYGAPAANLDLEAEILLNTVRERPDSPGFQFGLADEEDQGQTRIAIENLDQTDEDGNASFEAVVANLPQTSRPLTANIAVRMREEGGRAVERQLNLPVVSSGAMIGVRPQFDDFEIAENSAAKFSVIAVDQGGKRQVLRGLKWSLHRLEHNYQWYRDGSYWRYESVVVPRLITSGTVDTKTGDPVAISAPVEWGKYRLTVETSEADGPATSVEFHAGWYVEATSVDTPDALEVALDQDSYDAGGVAKLKVETHNAGRLLVAIGSEKLYETFEADIAAGGGEVRIPVKREWGAGAYVTATLFRPGSAGETRLPARSIGTAWLKINPAERELALSLDLPEKIQPRTHLEIPVTVGSLAAGEEAYVTVAAVDVGILNLTRFTPPDPVGYYFGQRSLGLEIRDLYGRLIDGSQGEFGRVRNGGDGPTLNSQGNPPKEKLLALFSGIVRVGEDGKATIGFDVPQFNGTARVMGVAWSKNAVGKATGDVVIRDPIVLAASLPKVMAPGDKVRGTLEIANVDGEAGTYKLAAAHDDTLIVDDFPESVELAAGERKVVDIAIGAGRSGNGKFSISIKHDVPEVVEVPQNAQGTENAQTDNSQAGNAQTGNEQTGNEETGNPQEGAATENSQGTQQPPVMKEVVVATVVQDVFVRPATLPVTEVREFPMASRGSLRLDAQLLAQSVPEGARIGVSVTKHRLFDVPALLTRLDRYPYGCAEQTTSRALPLLYLSDFDAPADLLGGAEIGERIDKAIARILTFQAASGSFGLWGPEGEGDLWLDSYITDFLTRAAEKGHVVAEQAMRLALQNLQNALSYEDNVTENGNQIAYALYVLARNRMASVGDLRYYADTKLDEFQTPLARAHLGAALALYSEQERSNRVFSSALERAKETETINLARSDYGSALRDNAAVLALASESRPTGKIVPDLIGLVEEEIGKRKYTSTQEDAWLLLAARAVQELNASISLEVNGANRTGALAMAMDGSAIEAEPVVITNRTGEALSARVSVNASPLQALPAGGEGFAITRTYYNLDGEEISPQEIVQNQRLVVVLDVEAFNDWPAQILVTDLLPGGLEIDNPRLVESADLASFDWLPEVEVAHSEFRNDRFVAALSRDSGDDQKFSLAYVVRAVTPGSYAHPAASVEDMYRPQLSARTATGFMEVLKAE